MLKSREYCIGVARLVRRDVNDILDIDSQRSLYESVDLKRDHQRQGEHHDGDEILDHYEHAAEYHFRLETEAALDHIYRFEGRNLKSGYDSGEKAGQHDKAYADADGSRGEVVFQHYPAPEHRGHLVLEKEGKPKAQKEGYQHHKGGFSHEFAYYLPGRTAQEPSRGHFPGSHSGICHRQVDIVGDGKEKYGNYGTQKDYQKYLVAFLQAHSVVLRIKHQFSQRSDTCRQYAAFRKIKLQHRDISLEHRPYFFSLRVQACSLGKEIEGLETTVSGAHKYIGSHIIAQNLRMSVN